MLLGVSVLGGGVALFFALLALPYIKSYKLRKSLSRLPGPPVKSSIKGHLAEFPPDRRDRPAFFLKWVEKYGSAGVMYLQFGPFPVVQVVGPEAAKEIVSSSKHSVKNFIYDPVRPWLGNGLLLAKGDRWKMMRRLTTPAFHFEVLRRFLDVMNEQVDVFISHVGAKADSGEIFDVFELITLCALDIICETAMGKKINAQGSQEGAHAEYVEAIYSICKAIVRRFEQAYLPDFVFFHLTSAGRQMSHCLKTLHRFTISVIQERKKALTAQEGFTGRPAFLDILLQAQREGEGITDEMIREEVDTFMFEGHDTTSASMAWTIQLLGLHPEIQERVYEEVMEVMGEEKDLTNEMLGRLHYLEMVLKESLRLYPSVPAIGRELTEDVVFDGVTVPKGSNVGLSIFSLHHNPRCWQEPEKFDPERWTPENSAGRDPYQYIPFSAGSRNCIGQKFAQNEEKVLLAKMIKNFKIESMEQKPRMLAELILRPCDGIKIKVQRRKAL